MSEVSLTFYHNVSTGILRSFSRSKKYWETFSFKASSHENSYYPKNAFDFSTHDYWIGDVSNTPNSLSFCFKHFSVIPTAYEITSSFHNNVNALPLKWAFSGGNDESDWKNSIEIEQLIEVGKTLIVPWASEVPFRCFQITTIQSSRYDISNRFDISEIDVYGSIIFHQKTLHQIFHMSLRIFLSQAIILFFSF